ncbi:MAG: hypothetical protein MUP81_02895 [Dehalococcoidia bacterium]|nr:hypothetical protein [Dehalococcoidia bacterium]
MNKTSVILNLIIIACALAVGILETINPEPTPLCTLWIWLGIVIISRLQLL